MLLAAVEWGRGAAQSAELAVVHEEVRVQLQDLHAVELGAVGARGTSAESVGHTAAGRAETARAKAANPEPS